MRRYCPLGWPTSGYRDPTHAIFALRNSWHASSVALPIARSSSWPKGTERSESGGRRPPPSLSPSLLPPRFHRRSRRVNPCFVLCIGPQGCDLCIIPVFLCASNSRLPLWCYVLGRGGCCLGILCVGGVSRRPPSALHRS